MPIYQLGEQRPKIANSVWIAPCAQVIGNVHIDDFASIWFNTVIRADNDHIHIGYGSNIQDGCILHNDIQTPLTVERFVTVGHQAMLHGCTIGEGSLVGMQSTILNRSQVGKNSLVGAGSLITEDKRFPDGVLIFGRPAKVIRKLTTQEIDYIHSVAQSYIDKAKQYSKELIKIESFICQS